MPHKAIPDRWIPYKACGEVIEGTRFICFKVPLRRSIQRNVREIKQIWDIPTLVAEIPKLGAVIDLTNTARYYDPRDFCKANILHKKILMPGRVIPPERSVEEFMKAVDEFLGRDGESLVGVHCTHGLNRTGYMVCRYMRDRLGIPAPDTIRRFETARGYKIERENYRNGILGKDTNSASVVASEREVVPVEPVNNRRNNFTYSSPLLDENYAAPPENRSLRFGNNRFGGNNNASTSRDGQSGFYSCYTDRYNNDSNTGRRSGKNRKDNRPDESQNKQSNWRTRDEAGKHGEASGKNNSSRKKRNDGSRGCKRRRVE